MLLRDKLYSGGHWAAPRSKESLEVHHAGTGEVMGTVPAGTEQDIDAAARAARNAFDGWSRRPVAERADFLLKISAGLKQRGEALAATIAQEVGMPIKL